MSRTISIANDVEKMLEKYRGEFDQYHRKGETQLQRYNTVRIETEIEWM